MGRKPRIEFEGALYHVIQRGNNKEFIFDTDREKNYLLKKLSDCQKVLNFKLYGYVIMGNHYHLILQTLTDPLQKIMHKVNSSFARNYNYRKKRTGHVFEGRYKGILVQEEKYVLALLRYVHQNPIRAGVCENVWEYPWSSDAYYRHNQQGFIDIDLILDILSNNRERAIVKYKNFVQQKEDHDYSSVYVLGDENFVLEHTSPEYEHIAKGLDKILLNLGVGSKERELIKRGSRKRELIPYKKAFAREARIQNYTLRQIAQHIHVSQSGVSKMLK